jgi:hypothetical protein
MTTSKNIADHRQTLRDTKTGITIRVAGQRFQ